MENSNFERWDQMQVRPYVGKNGITGFDVLDCWEPEQFDLFVAYACRELHGNVTRRVDGPAGEQVRYVAAQGVFIIFRYDCMDGLSFCSVDASYSSILAPFVEKLRAVQWTDLDKSNDG